MNDSKTSDLEKVLSGSTSDLSKAIKDLHTQDFSDYMKDHIREHGITQQQVFLNGDLSQGYGYKLLSGEKHTSQRDTILRLCYGAEFTLEETQRALKLYGFSPLYVKIHRDALLMKGFVERPGDIFALSDFLVAHGEKELKPTN